MQGYGLEQLRAHVPDLRSPARSLLIGLIGIAAFAAATAAMLVVDYLWPAWTLLGQIAIVAVAFGCIAPFFWLRKKYQARWGEKAYRHAFLFHVLTGLPIMLAAIVHTAYLPGVRIVTGWAALVVSMIGLYLMVTGLVLWLRAVFAFGFDNLAMLYVYFPTEGHIIDSTIYSILRHPVYSAVMRMGLALGLWRGTWASIVFGVYMPLGLTLWLWLIEERELIERFGEGYAKYRRKTPAFVPRLRDSGKFWRFLALGL